MAKSKLTRRHFLQVAGGAIGLSALAACVPAAPAPATGETGAAAPAAEPGSLWVLHKQDYHAEYNDFIRAKIVEYAEANNQQLEVAFTSGFEGTGADVQKVAAAVQAGEPPDVWIDTVDPFRLDQLGLIQDVSDLQQQVIDMYGEPAPLPKKENFRDGKYVGVILHTRSDGGWARTDIFEPAGIDIHALKTYDELREACLAVSDPDNEMWGWGIPVNRNGDGAWMVNRVIHGWGATYTDETGEIVTLDSPEAVEAVNWMVETYTDPKWEPMLPPGIQSWGGATNNESYLGGIVAYTQNAGTVYAAAVSDGLDIADTTTFDFPKGGPVLEEFMGMTGTYMHIIEGAKNPDHARQLILGFFDEAVMEAMFETSVSYALPAYEPQWEWDVITRYPINANMKAAAFHPTAWNGLAWPGPSTGQAGAVSAANVQTDMVANVLSGQMTAEEAVKDAHAKMVQIFKEFGAAGE